MMPAVRLKNIPSSGALSSEEVEEALCNYPNEDNRNGRWPRDPDLHHFLA